ncbi:hypothetical protein ACFQFH_14985 [Halobaculum halobium]|uniref:Uncharacterized protein n=1 Tax=Halobaculum halobium TaxID=3032281 RepID=A0ABD5TCW9_9EURY|nr:hypothetical protein [Halobaculum sp. SYNS20]
MAVGETQVAIEMLDPRSGMSDHYTTGTHEVIAISGESQESVELQLAPDIRITDVSQYTDGKSNIDLARLVVTVENTGTAPAWLTDFAVRGAPNWATNEELIVGSGIPYFGIQETPAEALIEAGESQQYVADESPFLFDEDGIMCDSGDEVILLVGISDGSHIRLDLDVSYGGDVYTVRFGETVCSALSISITRQRLAHANPSIRGAT